MIKWALLISLLAFSALADDPLLLNMEGANFYEMIHAPVREQQTINEFQARAICNDLRKSIRKALGKETDKTSEKYQDLQRQSEILFFIGGIMERNSQKSLYDYFLIFIRDHDIDLPLGVQHVQLFEEFFIYLSGLYHQYATMQIEELTDWFEKFVCSHETYGKIFNQGMFVTFKKNTSKVRKSAGGYQALGWLRSGHYAWKTGLITCAAAIAISSWAVGEYFWSSNPARAPMPEGKMEKVIHPPTEVTPAEKEITLEEYLEKRSHELKRSLPGSANSNRPKN